jgi:hypothetical protein
MAFADRQARRRELGADPAANAAALLFRIGFGLLVIIMPTAAVMSRRATAIIMPIAAVVLLLASLLMSDTPDPRRRIGAVLLSPIGLAASFFVVWSAVSLLWSPFPSEGAERMFRVVGSIALAVGAILALPERMRASNLYLVAIGVALAAVVMLAVQFGRLQGPDPTAGDRATILIVLLGWPAVAWLSMKRRSQAAMLVAALVGALVLSAEQEVLRAAALAGAIVLGGAIANRRATALAVGGVSAGLIFLAPLAVLAITQLTPGLPGEIGRFIAVWAEVIIADPARVVTGHGIETALRNRLSNTLTFDAPRSLIFEIWYELGLLGAFAVSLALGLAALRFGRLPGATAPFALGCMGFALTLAVAGAGTSQTWWLTALTATAVVFAAVVNGHYRTERPVATPRPSDAQRLPG